MPVKAKILVDEHEVLARLAELDLKLEWLLDILRHYGLALNSQTDDHPTWGRSISPASEAVFAMRSRLKPAGWTKAEEKGFALTIHPMGRFAVNIAKGDEGTGDALMNVTTSAEKGVCTEAAVSQNQYLLDLPPPHQSEALPRPTWYLIIRKKADGLYGELSLPIGLIDKHISLWRERIILPKVREDEPGVSSAGFEDDGFAVIIRRKQ